MAGNSGADMSSAGSGGFTLIAGPSDAGAEFKVVSSTQNSPFSVPITLNNDMGGVLWGMFGDAVQAASTTPPIPEYPLGLPILAFFTALAYGVIRRRTRN
ncbi:MAG: hypothetical protein ACLP5V_14070 [Candidatus Bathyarchaeia archaeon]